MAEKKRLKLDENMIKLLEFTAGDLIPVLESKPDLAYVQETAFGYYSQVNNEEFQVQVTVTRLKDDFLEPFTRVECSTKNM